MSNPNQSNQSDLDQDAYLELMQESAKSGKSVQQILKERKDKDKDKDKDKKSIEQVEEKTPEQKRKEVREFLSKNRLNLVKQEQ